MREKRYV